MKYVLGVLAIWLVMAATEVQAGMYVSGSISLSQANLNYQTYESRHGSASVGFDLFRYVRLNFSHSQEFTVTKGYKDPPGATEDNSPASNDDPSDDGLLIDFYSKVHVIGNSVDLQLILYEGQVFVPYVTAGLIFKKYRTYSREVAPDGTVDIDQSVSTWVPGPNLGAGMGMRINKDFTLKLQYIASMGLARKPFEPETRLVWDRKVTLGITYQI